MGSDFISFLAVWIAGMPLICLHLPITSHTVRRIHFPRQPSLQPNYLCRYPSGNNSVKTGTCMPASPWLGWHCSSSLRRCVHRHRSCTPAFRTSLTSGWRGRNTCGEACCCTAKYRSGIRTFSLGSSSLVNRNAGRFIRSTGPCCCCRLKSLSSG